MTDPTPRELAIKICALDERIDARFIALDRVLELQGLDKRDKMALSLALFSIGLNILIAVFTFMAMRGNTS